VLSYTGRSGSISTGGHRRRANHRVIDRLQASKPVPDLGHVRPRLGSVVIHHTEHPHPAVSSGPGYGGIGAQRRFGTVGMIVLSRGRNLRQPRAPLGSAAPAASGALPVARPAIRHG
jgi:hypothetical protein